MLELVRDFERQNEGRCQYLRSCRQGQDSGKGRGEE